MRRLLCSFAILGSVLAQGVGASTTTSPTTAVVETKRCFIHNRNGYSIRGYCSIGIFVINLGDLDHLAGRKRTRLQILLHVRNDQCLKYVINDRRKQGVVFGIANCVEPGVVSETAPSCQLKTGDTIIKKKKVKGATSPADCADLCEADSKNQCLLWVFNKRARPLVCIHVLLRANPDSADFSSFQTHYCSNSALKALET